MQDLEAMQVPSLGWEDHLEKGTNNPPWYSCLENQAERRERRGEKRDKVGPCTFPQDLVEQDPCRIFSPDLGTVCQAFASRIWFYEQFYEQVHVLLFTYLVYFGIVYS